MVLGDYFGRRSHTPSGHRIIYAWCYCIDVSVLEKMLANDDIWNTVLSFANIDDSVECFTTVLLLFYKAF